MKVNIRIEDLELRNFNPIATENKESVSLEIVRWQSDSSCYTVAYWEEENTVFVGDRPLHVNKGIFWGLIELGQTIIQKDYDRME
jgi:hypothetical protein